MKIPILKKSYCCIDLTIGAAITGWIGSIFALLDVTVLIYNLTGVDDASLDLQTVLSIIMAILFFAVSVCLMMATQSENRRLVIPWLVSTVLILIATNTMFIYFAMETVAGYIYLSLGIWNLVFGYVWLCIYSYYYDLKTGY